MCDLCPPYLQQCVAPIRKQPQRTTAGGRAACTRPQRGRTCGDTGPAGPTAATGGLSGPSAPAGQGPCCLTGLPPQSGGRGWREELQEAPAASLSHLGPSGSLFLIWLLNFSPPFLDSFFFSPPYSFDLSLFCSLVLLFLLVHPSLPSSPFLPFFLDYSFSPLYLLVLVFLPFNQIILFSSLLYILFNFSFDFNGWSLNFSCFSVFSKQLIQTLLVVFFPFFLNSLLKSPKTKKSNIQTLFFDFLSWQADIPSSPFSSFFFFLLYAGKWSSHNVGLQHLWSLTSPSSVSKFLLFPGLKKKEAKPDTYGCSFLLLLSVYFHLYISLYFFFSLHLSGCNRHQHPLLVVLTMNPFPSCVASHFSIIPLFFWISEGTIYPIVPKGANLDYFGGSRLLLIDWLFLPLLFFFFIPLSREWFIQPSRSSFRLCVGLEGDRSSWSKKMLSW